MIKIFVEKIPKELGGGYESSVEPFRFYLCGDGDSVIESLEDLIKLIKSRSIEDLYAFVKGEEK